MLNLTAIERFIEEQQDVASLQGNCGRRIRRFIERNFTNNEARFTLTSTHEHLMQFAFNVGKMDDAANMAQQAVAHLELPAFLTFSVENIDTQAGTMDVVVTTATIPEGLKERQQFLDSVAFGLRRFNAVGFLNQPHVRIEDFLQQTFGMEGASEPLDTSSYFRQFDKLLASDFSELEDTTGYVTTLAGFLNPAVDVEIHRLEAEYDKVVDAAFAYHATPVFLSLERLFGTQAQSM
jgi:hypothetical protein